MKLPLNKSGYDAETVVTKPVINNRKGSKGGPGILGMPRVQLCQESATELFQLVSPPETSRGEGAGLKIPASEHLVGSPDNQPPSVGAF